MFEAYGRGYNSIMNYIFSDSLINNTSYYLGMFSAVITIGFMIICFVVCVFAFFVWWNKKS